MQRIVEIMSETQNEVKATVESTAEPEKTKTKIKGKHVKYEFTKEQLVNSFVALFKNKSKKEEYTKLGCSENIYAQYMMKYCRGLYDDFDMNESITTKTAKELVKKLDKEYIKTHGYDSTRVKMNTLYYKLYSDELVNDTEKRFNALAIAHSFSEEFIRHVKGIKDENELAEERIVEKLEQQIDEKSYTESEVNYTESERSYSEAGEEDEELSFKPDDELDIPELSDEEPSEIEYRLEEVEKRLTDVLACMSQLQKENAILKRQVEENKTEIKTYYEKLKTSMKKYVSDNNKWLVEQIARRKRRS